MTTRLLGTVAILWLASPTLAADVGNRLRYVNEFCDPYYVGSDTARLVTPQWIGEDGVELAIVLAIDDLGDTAVYEKFLRPVFDRLKQVDGRAAVSMMTGRVHRDDPQLQAWLKEGVNLETHTYDHPCPCLGVQGFEQAKSTFDRAIDFVAGIPNSRPVAFRMPCCDSMNSASPRFYAEVFNKTTPQGRFVSLDSSIFMLFTASDPLLPRSLVQDEDSKPRFAKYIPTARKFINYIEDYPYPYVIGRLCWEMPSAIPDDWMGNDHHQPRNPATVRDMKAAIDATAIKQGTYTLTFHPHTHNWVLNSQVVEMVSHALDRYGKKVKFLNFREVYDRITQNALGGQPLRAANGQDNGVRVLDLDNDGYMDAVIGNEKVRQTRVWSPQTRTWTASDMPVEIISVDSHGNRRDAGVGFGVLDPDGRASLLVRNEKVAGVWHFDGARWVAVPHGLDGLEVDGPVMTCIAGRDRGVRLVDLDRDGVCELIVANEKQSAVFCWSAQRRAWQRLPFGLPAGTMIVDGQGRDAGCRLVDVDSDGHVDVVFSNADRNSLHRFVSMTEGWSRTVFSGKGGDTRQIPAIVRADGSNNGVWFKHGCLNVQNEDTGFDIQLKGQSVRIPSESRPYAALLDSQSAPTTAAAK